MPGYNSFMGYDPINSVTLIIWTNLTLSLDGLPTANAAMLKLLDQIYVIYRSYSSRVAEVLPSVADQVHDFRAVAVFGANSTAS